MAITEKQSKFCAFGKLELKEAKEDFHVSGFVATSHPDRAEEGDFAGDIIPRSTLQKIATDINNKYKPQAGAVSERHDHLKGDPDAPIAGVAVGPAELRQLDDGEWGVHVDTILSKTNPRYDEIKTNIEQGVYPGFSIEYITKDFVPTEKEGKKYRMLTDIETEGFGYANRRMIANPHAEYTDYGFKEIMSPEVDKMVEDKQLEEMKALHDSREDIKKTSKKKKMKKGDNTMTDKKEENVEEKKDDAPVEKTEEAPVEEKAEEKTEPAPAAEEKEHTVSAQDMALLTKFKESQAQEAKVKEITESKEFKAILSEKMKAVKEETAPVFNTDEEGKPEFKELEDYRASLKEMEKLDEPIVLSQTAAIGAGTAMRESMHKNIISKQYKEASKLYTSLVDKGVKVFDNFRNSDPTTIGKENSFDIIGSNTNRVQMKEFSRVEMKANGGLGVTNATNANLNLADSSWTYGSYFLSPVELNDIFQPVLVNQLNDQTTTWGRLQKVDWSGRSQIQFRARTGRNSTVGGYAEGTNLTYGTDFSGNVGRDKYQQPFSYYRVLVAVTGQAMRLAQAPGGMGDVWADEIKWSGEDLLAGSGGLNLAVIGTGAGTSESTALGFEGLILGTTGTLYGKALSSNATLRSHKENVSSARVTMDQLRKMIRFVSIGDGSGSSQIHSNSRLGDLVFICNHLQRDFIKALIQDMQRLVPTSGRVGFEGEIEFDGVPIIGDRQMNTDDIFLINTANTKIGMNLPPTLEPLPVTADAQAAQIKIYWNLYSDAPGNNYFANTFATS